MSAARPTHTWLTHHEVCYDAKQKYRDDSFGDQICHYLREEEDGDAIETTSILVTAGKEHML